MAHSMNDPWGYAGGYGGWQAYGGDNYGRQNWHWRYRRLGFWLTQQECARPQVAQDAACNLDTPMCNAVSDAAVAVKLVADTYRYSKPSAADTVPGNPQEEPFRQFDFALAN